MNNVEEELISKIMMCAQKYIKEEDLQNFKNDIVCCTYDYNISEKQKGALTWAPIVHFCSAFSGSTRISG